MNLPLEIRYRRYEDWSDEEFEAVKENVRKSPWRASYHIEPKTGLLNDPNGFSFFNGKFHVFYQNWPYGPAHGLKQWVDTVSDDLVHFEETGVKLLPNHKNDYQGAYSGSALEIDGRLFLLYTGNTRDENWVRTPLQIGAWMDKNGHIEKMDNVLIDPPKDVTDHFRDPQIFTYNHQIYCVIGAQDTNKRGFIKLYKAIDNDITNWKFIDDLDFKGKKSEYMVECPNIVFIDGKAVLIYCPQGLDKKELNYDNIYPNTYRIFDEFDAEHAKLIGEGTLENLDYGFETYATQCMTDSDGKVYAISWIGLPDVASPTDQYDYHGAMSLIKELKIKNGKLLQYPVKAIESLRKSSQPFNNMKSTSNCYELELTMKGDVELLLFENEGTGLKLKVENHKFIVDRSNVGEQYALEYKTIRSCEIEQDTIKVNIFVDNSIIEIFINEGEKVFTSRVFPSNEENGIKLLSGDVQGTYYDLEK